MEEAVIIKKHKLEGLVKEAIAEAELLYPGEIYSAEVELSESLTLVIKVFRGTQRETKIL